MKCHLGEKDDEKKNLIPEAGWRMLVLFLQEYGCRVKTVSLDRGAGTGNDREEIRCLTVHEDFLHRRACQKLLEKNHRHCQGTATTEGETCNSADRLGPDSCHSEAGSQGAAVSFPATFCLGKKRFWPQLPLLLPTPAGSEE